MTDSNPDDIAMKSAADFGRALVPCWQSALGADLLGVYLLGSLAHGGFSRRYSDVDILVVTAAGLTQAIVDRVRREAAALSAEWAPKLSVFWSDRDFSIGRLPPLDRVDFLDRPVVLLERERVRPQRPTFEEIRRYLRGAPFGNWQQRAQHFAAAAALDPAERKPYLRAQLYPARFCYSYLTGEMGSNDAAVAFLQARAVPGLDVALIERTLDCRRAAADPDSLFPSRTVLPVQIAACAALIARYEV
jgi:predicted nucleotidyltransferase